jgi:hypothetical protein
MEPDTMFEQWIYDLLESQEVPPQITDTEDYGQDSLDKDC